MRTRSKHSLAPRLAMDGARGPFARGFLSILTALAVIASVVVPVTAVSADGFAPAAVRNVKTSNAFVVRPGDGILHPGDRFNWMIEVGCSVLDAECVGAALTDVIPPQFNPPVATDILLTPALSSSERTIIVVGQTVTVNFTQDLVKPLGQKGLTNGTVTVTIPVTVRSDLDFTPTPITVTNTSQMVAVNAPMVPSSASVQINVPLQLAAGSTKSFNPTSNIAVAGLSTQMTLGGSNDSNAPVSTLTIQDPLDPTSATNPLRATALEISSLNAIVWPTGAISAIVSLWDSTTSAWVDGPSVTPASTTDLPGLAAALPPAVNLTNARGIRVVFSSSSASAVDIPRDASTSLAFGLKNRTGITAKAYPNTTSTVVSRDALSATKTSTATYTVTAATSALSAGKTISPNRMSTVAYGANDLTQGTVTLTGGNAGSIALSSLTINEPTNPALLDATNPLAPAHLGGGLIFSGFTGGVTWPAGAANAASITYYYSDGSNETKVATKPTMPVADVLKRVTGFSVTFTGTMAPSTLATLPYTIEANPLQVAPDFSVPYSNTIQVTGTDIYSQPVTPKSATATVTVLADQINLSTTKTVSRTSLRAVPGQSTTAILKTHVLDYPDSTRSLNHIDMIDPSVESGTTEWYQYFDATALVVTPIPLNSTLTISYRDSVGTYLPMVVLSTPGLTDYTIPAGLRDQIYGLKLSWDSTTGYVPNQDLTANITYSLRSTLRDSVTPLPNVDKNGITNCSSTVGTTPALPDVLTSNTAASNPCPKVNLLKVDTGPGGTNLLDKRFIKTTNPILDQDVVPTQLGDPAAASVQAQTRVRLSWSTDGYTGVSKMVVYDGAVDGSGNPAPGSWNLGMYDAFDLYSIPAINNALDPLMKYDQVTIKVFDSTLSTPDWVEIPGYCTVAAPCKGSTPTKTFSQAQRLAFVAVQFTFTEGPVSSRTTLNPAVGSGVADSIAHNRNIDLVFQLRDTLRSNGQPVVDGYQYNAPVTGGSPSHSVILNDARSEATLVSGGPLVDHASDTFTLLDAPLAISVTKTWTGGSLPIPDNTVLVRPTSRVTITAQNQTVGKVKSLTINEPNQTVATPNYSPFEDFNLTRFQSITAPAGATGLTITVTRPNAGNLTTTGTVAFATNVALTSPLWSPAALADATGFSFVFTGPIKGVTGTTAASIVFDLGLRENMRANPLMAVAPGTDRNSTQGIISDTRWDPTSPVTAPVFVPVTLAALDQAHIDLVSSDISVTTSKTFQTATETEPSRSVFNLTLNATPGGSERVQTLTVTDDSPTFWNAFDFTGKPAASPALQTFSPTSGTSGTVIRVDACVGGTWTAMGVSGAPTSTCTDRGGNWVLGTWKTAAQAQANFLPTGVATTAVEGIRFTVKRADDSQWENPQAPTISIPISVQRRTDLRTGGPVLTNLPVNSAAPGESVLGTTTNKLTADVVGIWGKTATATNSASYLYQYAVTGVTVEKNPAGVESPGRVFNYTLKATNSGSWPIMNPVITDYLPSEDVGGVPTPQLIFDPDNPWHYTYALTGAPPSPSNGTALPSGTTGPTVVVTPQVTGVPTSGPKKIEFAFPAGSVLEVGQTYTITIPMMFRPGLVNNVNVTNTFGIRGDRKFDSCLAPLLHVASYDATSGECSTPTTVQPSEQAALRALMVVKADLDSSYPNSQGFIGGSNADCIAAQDSDGFSRLPCIPKTLPGQEETWRLVAQNTGTTQMPRLVLSLRLPAVGDKTILDNFVRDSKWAAGFTGEITANLGVTGATMTTYYTLAPEPCKLVLENPFDPNACGSNPGTVWYNYATDPPADTTLVTGLQFVIDFPDSHLFKPAETVTIEVVTRTAAMSSTTNPDSTANNSLSAAAITRTGSGQSAVDTKVTALDYSVVSVALATGNVRLHKTITGAASSFIPDGQIFSGNLVCTSLGVTTTRSFTMTLSGGTVADTQFDNLPGGSSCTVDEDAASGQSSYTAPAVIINPLLTDPADYPTITLTNDYALASLKVTKTVLTTAPIIPTAFTFTVSCTFLGVAVPLALADASFTLDATQSRTITGIPANSDCVVTETDAKGADGTVMTGQTDAGHPGGSVALDDTARTVTFTHLSPDNAGAVTNFAEAENLFDAPALLVLKKDRSGGGAAQFGDRKTFGVHVLCEFPDATQYDATIDLNAANGWTKTLPNIIAGSVCTITEPDLNGADAVVITPNDGVHTTVGTFTVPGGPGSPQVAIKVNNWYLTGSVEVTKTFAGDDGAIDKFARDPSPAIEFEFTLSCTRDGELVVIPGTGIRTVTAADPVADYPGLASGSVCTISETKNGGSSETRILDHNGDALVDGEFTVTVDPTVLSVDDQAQGAITVENTYRLAEVSASKTVVDIGRKKPSSIGPFQLTLTCTLDGRDIEAAETATQSINNGQTVTWTALAEGADCTVAETDDGGATRTTTTLMAADGSKGPVVEGTVVHLLPLRSIVSDSPNQINFVNSFQLAYTGSDVSSSGLMLPLGLLLGGGILFGFALLERRRRGGGVHRS